MRTPQNDPGIEHEPHLRADGFRPDPSELPAAQNVQRSRQAETSADQVEHTVWDEPGLSPSLSGAAPADALTYAKWIEERIAGTSAARSWLTVLGVALVAGPFAILGAFVSGGEETAFGLLVLTVFGPVMEEMLKVGIPLWVVEKRPFLFRSRAQTAGCALASGFVFAAVENVLYLNVYISDPSPLLVQWRWTVCVALHLGCTFVASLGLMKIWAQAIEKRIRPQLMTGNAYLITAMVIHGSYNALAVLLKLMGFEF